MISSLKGIVIAKEEKTITLDVNGVGYEVHVTDETLSQTSLHTTEIFFIHLNIKENILELYGFRTHDERKVFSLLLDVTGIGPRSALNILNAVRHDELASAVGREDVAGLVARGVGKKTAEKLVHELHEKVNTMFFSTYETRTANHDLIAALVSLGYSQNQITQVLSHMPKSSTSTEEQIRQALKLLSIHK